jgi:hypothetical protein
VKKISKGHGSLYIELILFFLSPLYIKFFDDLINGLKSLDFVTELKRRYSSHKKHGKELLIDLIFRTVQWMEKSENKEIRMTFEINGVKVTLENIPPEVRNFLKNDIKKLEDKK